MPEYHDDHCMWEIENQLVWIMAQRSQTAITYRVSQPHSFGHHLSSGNSRQPAVFVASEFKLTLPRTQPNHRQHRACHRAYSDCSACRYGALVFRLTFLTC